MPINVLMTRTTDVYVGLSERAAFANRNNAKLFISYHLNAATALAKGYEDFTYPTQNHLTIKGRDTYHGVVLPALRQLRQINRGKKVANFAVLRETNMPAVLVELGFITNAAEYDTINGRANFELLAKTHAQAIKKTLQDMGVKDRDNVTVILDPGHGGGDPGAVANGHTEAAYVLRFTKRVKEILLGSTIKVEEKTKEPEVEIIKEVLKDMKLNNTTRKDIQALNNQAVKNGLFTKLIVNKAEWEKVKDSPNWADKYNAVPLEDMTDDDLKNKTLSYFLRKEIKNNG